MKVCGELRVVLLICLLLEVVTLLSKLSVCQEHETMKPNHGAINIFARGGFL